MKSAHDLGRQRRWHERVDKIPLQGVVCLLPRCRWQTPDESHPGIDAVPVMRRFLYD
jgi:hypothetical protein